MRTSDWVAIAAILVPTVVSLAFVAYYTRRAKSEKQKQANKEAALETLRSLPRPSDAAARKE